MAVTLSSVAQVVRSIASARDVAFGSYVLPAGPIREALDAAARRGAHVAVTLQADPYRNPSGARANAAAARALRRDGATVTLLPSERTPFHIKGAVCDGVAFLDDRNWTQRGPDTVIADRDGGDVALVRAALAGRGGATSTLATRKDEALRREVDLVERAGPRSVIVETERASTSPLTRALQRHAEGGAPTTLVIGRSTHHSAREAHALAALRASGVTVREHGSNEKLAVAGGAAWIGSGNATGASGRGAGQIEWGMLTREPALVAAARASLARDAARG